jgi:hypothetical protein
MPFSAEGAFVQWIPGPDALFAATTGSALAASKGALWRLAASQPPTLLAELPSYGVMYAYPKPVVVADDEYFFFLDRDAVLRVPKSSGGRAQVLAHTRSWPTDLVVATAAVFWLEEEQADGPRFIETLAKPSSR